MVKASTSDRTAFRVLGAISFAHFLNDTLQSLMVAIYPLFKAGFHLSFAQIGLITLVFQLTASLLQPLVGLYTDRHPKPSSLAVGMGFTLLGLLALSLASSFPMLLMAAAMVGTGSAVFHPEASRIARMASGGRHGLAQSIFQVGGNTGAAIGPLLAAWIVLPQGQRSLAVFALLALVAMIVLTGVGVWSRRQHRQPKPAAAPAGRALPKGRVKATLAVLLALMFSKFFYLASISSYLIFYLMQRYAIDAQEAQYHLFYFLFAVAAGTLFGGPLGDRIGRRAVIWVSILGVAPFTLALPYVGLGTSAVLTVIIGFLLASAFPAIVVYAQELLPGRVGMVSGLFFRVRFRSGRDRCRRARTGGGSVGDRDGLSGLRLPAVARIAGGPAAGSAGACGYGRRAGVRARVTLGTARRPARWHRHAPESESDPDQPSSKLLMP